MFTHLSLINIKYFNLSGFGELDIVINLKLFL
jgi:hypothetical protein